MPKATKALNKYGIEINSATNGVYLPTPNADTSKVTTEVVHSKPNGKEYKELYMPKNKPSIVTVPSIKLYRRARNRRSESGGW